MTQTKVMKAASMFIYAVLTVLILSLPSICWAKEPIRTLGKDTLGETLKEFRIHYPKAACGRTTSLDINPQNLVHSGNMDDTDCCLNDRDSLTEVSQFPILNLDDCAVHGSFSKGRLSALMYMLDVRSIQIVLDDFLKLYGPPTRMLNRMMKDPEDATQLTLVDWWQGMTILELHTATIDEDAFAKYSLRKTGAPPLHVVCVNLWNSLIAAA